MKKIKIKTGTGEFDTIGVVDPLTIPLIVRCGSRQELCGTSCFSPETFNCCDAATGCVVGAETSCEDVICPAP